jgi:hypothetical protein
VVWMRQMHVLIMITSLFHLAYQVLSCKNYEAWINNMHVSMQALPAKTRDSRALFDDAIWTGRAAGEDGKEESDEKGKAQKKEEKKRRSPERGSFTAAVEWTASAA